ncbi:protein STPG4-like [Amphiura filiformis]|uniref:protein STPG4-like n=1 Tax=Amphiura filiformis TaxID=82378 RepID=UPI003B227189
MALGGMVPEATSTSNSKREGSAKKVRKISRNGDKRPKSRTASATSQRSERIPIYDRKTPKKDRTRLSENYDAPASGRESWWRKDIRETPVPGAYESKDFVNDLETRPATYQFKNEGRKKDADVQRRGSALLPGAYEKDDLVADLDKKYATYAFKNTSRESNRSLGVKDKACNVCPTAYPMEKFLSCSVEKTPSKHHMFRSNAQRFPTIYFKGTTNPPPDRYDYNHPSITAALHPISSSFKSKTPRFVTSHTKVPGPGTYDKAYQSPMPATIAKMGRNHGLFFTSAFSS